MIINKRFGLVPQAIEEKIGGATTCQLEDGINASLDAASLHQIFKACLPAGATIAG